ncbi:hypothetical protein IKF20_01690 [Candidatus Saccharibacteria bacterium]|nr:hypothetical protein [Candidatus Saccharibacteria bacterium]
MKKSIIAVLIIVLGGLFFGALGVTAEEEEEKKENGTIMTISPPRQKIVLVPGETFEGSITVSNAVDSSSALKYSVTIGSFGLHKDENGKSDYEDSDLETVTGYNQIMDWIKLGKEKGTIEPNESDTVPFTITVPSDAPAGGQYATIIVQNDSSAEGSGDGSVSIQNVVRFASTVIAEIAGETRRSGEILENSIPAFVFSSPLPASSTVKNNGNVHTDAKYSLQVWPLFSDEEICTNEEEPTESLIMPETERLHVEECNLPAIGIYRAKQTVEIFGEKSVMEKTIFMCPLWLLFLIVFVIVALVIWIVTKTKNKKSHKQSERKEEVAE